MLTVVGSPAPEVLSQEKPFVTQREVEDRGGGHATDVLGWIKTHGSQGICASLSQMHQQDMPAL